MLRLILGRAGTGKTGRILREIAARAARGESSVLIVPEQYSHEAERELASLADNVCLWAEVLSFTRLSYRVAQETGGAARTYVDAGGRLLQLTLALEQVGGALSEYGGAARTPELLGELLSALDELRLSGASAETLRSAAGEAGGLLGRKLRDLALLTETMEALGARTGADPISRLEVLAEQIPGCPSLRGVHFYIDGFTDFTAQERAVIRALWQVGEVIVCLGCDPAEPESEIFALGRRTRRRLRQTAEEDGVAVTEETVSAPAPDGPLAFLESHLFGWTEETADSGGAVCLYTAPTFAAECELAAARVLSLVRERGCRWRDVAIAVRGFEELREPLEETFRRYGIPLYATARTDILARPLPTLIRAAYDILSDGWSYESVFAYLKTGLTDVTDAERDELENYVLLWSLRGGAWYRETPWRQHPDGLNQSYTEAAEETLRRLDALRRRIAAPLLALEAESRAAQTAEGQCRALAAFWDRIGLPERLAVRAEALETAGEGQTAAEYRQLWERTVSALEQCAAVLGNMALTRDEFARLFLRLLSAYDVGTIPVALDQVTAGDFDRMRRRQIRHLLVLGASDDRLPRLGGSGGVFTETERARLRDLNVELADEDDALARELGLIYSVIALPSDTLTVSYARFTALGRESQPSFLAERIGRLFALESAPGDLTEARRSAPEPALELACAGDASARAWFAADPAGAARLEALTAASRVARGRLGREAVRTLYGSAIRLTASQVEKLSECKYQYFLRYGLRAKPRPAGEFAPPDYGTFLHFLLENVARAAQERGGFAALDDDAVRALTEEYVEEYVHTRLEDFREKSPRFTYLFQRLRQTAARVVLDTARELRRSDFRPLDFELDLSKTDDIPPVSLGEGEDKLLLTGVADRVDGWLHDGKLYLRVADYKSGKKEFKLADVWAGKSLQMLLYLFALTKNGQAHYGREVVPAGVLYVPARDNIVRGDAPLTDEEIAEKKSKGLRRSGLLLNDPEVLAAMEHGDRPVFLPVKFQRGVPAGDALATAEQLGQLSGFLDELLRTMAAELRRGSIQADPWYRKQNENACLLCDYYDVCRFDEKTEPWRFRPAMKAPAFWEKLAEQEGGRSHAAD